MLSVRNIDVGYGAVQAVWDVSFDVGDGEVVTLIGANGAGKTTILKTLCGLLVPRRGQVLFDGADVRGLAPYELVARGLVLIPEARQLWPGMTVRENLDMGAYSQAARGERARTLDAVHAMFPQLEKRARQKAGTLSGGEQQMCAIGRGLMAAPRVLLIDELSLGLAPRAVELLSETLRKVNAAGVAILLVEQDVMNALELANRAYVIDHGRVTKSGPAMGLASDPAICEAYMGLSKAELQ